MNRRTFLTASTIKSTTASRAGSAEAVRAGGGINPYAGQWTRAEVIHLLRRTMFGAKKADVDFFASMSMNQAVDHLLNVRAEQPSPPLKTYANSTTPGDPDATIPSGSTWVNTNTTDGGINSQRRQSLKNWWIGLMINQERNIREKMVLFWHNHFSAEMIEISRGIWCYQNNLTLRTHALGNFRTFVKAVTLDTGMLRYLNGYLNTKTAPDENYGRELQELFTVGKGSDDASPPYTEDDVKAAARVLTGWAVDTNSNLPVFTLSKHDLNTKQFSSYYSSRIISGENNEETGSREIDELITMIFDTSDVALNICRRLYRWFFYYDIDPATEENFIRPLAQVFRDGNYEIQPLISAMLKSEHFFDVLNRGCLIKSPVDFVAGLCRESGMVFPDPADYVNNYNMWQYLAGIVKTLQQDPGDPPSVAGWPAYYQKPQYHEIWINSDTLPKRNQFSDLMNGSGYTRSGKTIKIDHAALASTMPDPADPGKLIEDSITYLSGLPITGASIDKLKTDILLGGQSSDSYWTSIWNTFKSNPGDASNTAIVKSRLAALYKYIMNIAEFQLS